MSAGTATSLPLVCHWILLWGLPTLAVAGAVAWALNVPAMRAERARWFLDALGLAIRSGRSPEQAIIELSSTRDSTLGARFHYLAAWIRSGLRFDEALQRTPSLISSKISAILVEGAEAGVLPGALKAAQRSAKLPDAQVRAALSCQIVMLFILNPLILMTLPYFLLQIFPVLEQIVAGFGKKTPFGMHFLIRYSPWIFAIQVVSIFALYFGAIFYVGGNRLTRWLEAGLFPLSAWIALRIPWKRKRLYRDFSTMLALLLDAGLPERKALEMAGAATDNEIFMTLVDKALLELEAGVGLSRALELLDPPKEFAWRLANALQRKGNFEEAMEGWFDALDAEADAQEQVAGDLVSTALVILNGAFVALIIAVVMQAIYSFGIAPLG